MKKRLEEGGRKHGKIIRRYKTQKSRNWDYEKGELELIGNNWNWHK